MERPIYARVLVHPFYVAALLLLILNDHFFKGSGLLPGWLTGKLSDFTGVIVFMGLGAALLARSARSLWLLAVPLMGWFVAVKVFPEGARAWEAFTVAYGIPLTVVADPTDLLALVILPPIMAWMNRAALDPESTRAWARLGVGTLAGVACLAEEPDDQTVDPGEVGVDAGDAGDADTADGDAGTLAEYLFVRIIALDPGDDGGPEIDAIQVERGDEVFYANAADCYLANGDMAPQETCNLALGTEGTECSLEEPNFVSLGGEGGQLIVSFEGDITLETGDSIVVFACHANGASYDVEVGVSPSPDDESWVLCALGAIGVTTCTVPNLPEVFTND